MGVPLVLVPPSPHNPLLLQFRGLGKKLVGIYPNLKYDLRNASIEIPDETFATASFFSALIWAVGFSLFVRFATSMRDMEPSLQLLLPVASFLPVFFFFFFFHLSYPKLIAKNVSDRIDRDLTYAARDMLVQVSSGIPLYNVFKNIAESDYGPVSAQFRIVRDDIRGGMPVIKALEALSLRTQSKFLKKTCWQLITALRSGANLTTTLHGIVALLVDYQFSVIKSYNAELNFIVLIYLLISAVLPTIGVTVLVIFSLFGILGITPELFATIVLASFVLQSIIIGYVKAKRPNM
ncbi:type II secretion system F family protein [Candidatus Micrarchaeota archaeon]|nr:type II secretion system F family protein [Candidatus Micrarchaeota archaeon]